MGSIGYLVIIVGVFGGPFLVWWLGFEGDIIDILHRLKMGLPGWGWRILKYSLSAAFGLAFMLFLILLGMLILAWGNQERTPRDGKQD